MNGLLATIKLDIRCQARSGLYAVGIFTAVLFGLIGRLIPVEYAGRTLSVIYLLSLSTTTYVFCASQVLADKTQGTLLALRAAPLTANAYMASKILTLTTFSVVEAAVIYGVGFWGADLNLLPLLVGVVVLGLLYACIGLGQVAKHTSVLTFLLPGVAIVGSVSQLPMLYVLGIGPAVLYYGIPSMAPLLLMIGTSEALEAWQWAYAIGVSIAAIAAAGLWAQASFRRYIQLSEAP
ncbi:MAG: hypothetical protein AAGE01_20725 [Pseudomonadota bacterium]